ncbi:MAG: hypothetical protein ACM30G_09845 [Micromonosporaceae bacterium]
MVAYGDGATAALETSLSHLWGPPRHRRFGPVLAGLAFDTVVLSALLTATLVSRNDFVDRFAAAAIADPARPGGNTTSIAALDLPQQCNGSR